MATAAQFGINVVAIVFNDGAYGNVKRDMRDLFQDTSLGVELQNPDFMKLAEAYGVEGMRVREAQDLSVAIETAINLNKPVLIEVPVGVMPNPF